MAWSHLTLCFLPSWKDTGSGKELFKWITAISPSAFCLLLFCQNQQGAESRDWKGSETFLLFSAHHCFCWESRKHGFSGSWTDMNWFGSQTCISLWSGSWFSMKWTTKYSLFSSLHDNIPIECCQLFYTLMTDFVPTPNCKTPFVFVSGNCRRSDLFLTCLVVTLYILWSHHCLKLQWDCAVQECSFVAFIDYSPVVQYIGLTFFLFLNQLNIERLSSHIIEPEPLRKLGFAKYVGTKKSMQWIHCNIWLVLGACHISYSYINRFFPKEALYWLLMN